MAWTEEQIERAFNPEKAGSGYMLLYAKFGPVWFLNERRKEIAATMRRDPDNAEHYLEGLRIADSAIHALRMRRWLNEDDDD